MIVDFAQGACEPASGYFSNSGDTIKPTTRPDAGQTSEYLVAAVLAPVDFTLALPTGIRCLSRIAGLSPRQCTGSKC